MPKNFTAALNSFLFAVVNHGVSEELVAEVFEQNRAFFALPDEQKRLILADCNNRQALVLPQMLQAYGDEGRCMPWGRDCGPRVKH